MAVGIEHARAGLACLTCKSGKRRCDKRLPICSRCKNPAIGMCRPADSTSSIGGKRVAGHVYVMYGAST
ncbi:hypothetical protein N7533_003759 [Penicillium manginii]|uniref:uncharacterized protein n=1 Tax=Penicillium manginii TaxID=203109 RepID=UPI0025495102|nr:uncharacterized protein N7533_003759 [Penicillium manginii]KAJ5754216.1 hypothetical protein N7533_003759 [Penicillium manginii]